MADIIKLYDNSIFHIHTRRCEHAGEEEDEAYILKAIAKGADAIYFTDHAPFPGNKFRYRMGIGDLDEYLDSLNELKRKYEGKIGVKIGLEIEYLPSYEDYYKKLASDERLEFMIVGQHFYEHPNGDLSFNDSKAYRDDIEYIGQFKAMISAVYSGLFTVIAHPDRAFRSKKEWDGQMEVMAENLIKAAIEKGVALEKNYTSMRHKRHYWKQFWDLAEKLAGESDKPLYIVYGYDAHSTFEMTEAKNKS